MWVIKQAESVAEIAAARQLFEEYARSLSFSLCFQGFAEELKNLPQPYAPPSGRLLLACGSDGVFAGCVGIRRLEDGICEMKRLYVSPSARGHGLGRLLAERVIQEACTAGYSRIRLDTVPGEMDAAIAMYRSLGFQEIERYYPSPCAGALYLERTLQAAASG